MMKRLGLCLFCAVLAVSARADEDKRAFLGGDVAIDTAVDRDVLAVGGNIAISAPVAGNVRAAGGDVEITSDAAITGNAAIASGNLTVRGAVKGNLMAGAGNVTLDGPIGGDATIGAGTLELGPNARIGGKLKFRGGHLVRHPEAVVTGGIEQRAARSKRKHRGDFGFGPSPYTGGSWLWTVGLMILAGLVAAALPGPSQRMASELRARPWMAAFLGFVALTCIPAAAVLIMITIIGIPIGILALLAYVALLLLGYVAASVVAGGILLDRMKAEVAGQAAWRAGAAVVAMLVISLLARVPILGGLVIFAALVIGIGVIVSAVVGRTRETPPPPPAEAVPA